MPRRLRDDGAVIVLSTQPLIDFAIDYNLNILIILKQTNSLFYLFLINLIENI